MFDYEKHLSEQIALDRERLEFEKVRFKKEVELRERELALRERELALREKHMEQKIALQKKLCEANRESAELESAKFYRLTEVLRNTINGAQSSSEMGSLFHEAKFELKLSFPLASSSVDTSEALFLSSDGLLVLVVRYSEDDNAELPIFVVKVDTVDISIFCLLEVGEMRS
ncbi:hypothetical protein PsorP6_003564 [Peronosclerospora sorghi]|uniref:Uncharacterized protein n=1 Tax=Peronosclerospora sorghi TaxID=230839 RepID=A0ACC0VKT5_9STRA|nr:hypothetical protein PsorP6_003564 [Peronosclerospora sorghi]